MPCKTGFVGLWISMISNNIIGQPDISVGRSVSGSLDWLPIKCISGCDRGFGQRVTFSGSVHQS